jgi:hypothetical protein
MDPPPTVLGSSVHLPYRSPGPPVHWTDPGLVFSIQAGLELTSGATLAGFQGTQYSGRRLIIVVRKVRYLQQPIISVRKTGTRLHKALARPETGYSGGMIQEH